MNPEFEDIIEDIERMAHEGKDRKEILAAFPHHQNDIEEYFFVTGVLAERKKNVLPSHALFASVMENISSSHVPSSLFSWLQKIWMPSAGAIVAAALLFILLWDNNAIMPASTEVRQNSNDSIQMPPPNTGSDANSMSMMAEDSGITDSVPMGDIISSAEREWHIASATEEENRTLKTFGAANDSPDPELVQERKAADTRREEFYMSLEKFAVNEREKKAVATFQTELEADLTKYRAEIDKAEEGLEKAYQNFKIEVEKIGAELRKVFQE